MIVGKRYNKILISRELLTEKRLVCTTDRQAGDGRELKMSTDGTQVCVCVCTCVDTKMCKRANSSLAGNNKKQCSAKKVRVVFAVFDSLVSNPLNRLSGSILRLL